MTTITALPAAPNRATDAPATYVTKADAMMAALPTFITETNTVAGEVNTNATTATTQASTATTQATNASNSAAAAAASAATAAAAPGTNATSTTSLTVGTGSKTLTIQTGKSLVVGMSVKIAYTTTPTTWMHGDITAYDTGTGSLTVYVTVINGSGTQAAWTVSLSSPGGVTLGANVFTGQQTFAEVKDTVYTISDGAAFEIDPANGSIQIVTLGASRTPAATNFEAGQIVLLGIDDGSAYAVTWTTVNPTWVKAGGGASAPTLATTGYTWVLLWKAGSTIYAVEVGKP
jgi:hypothetical protein